MNVVVTGAAGFVGSALSEALVASGASVRGVDCFTPYYDVEVKRDNLSSLVSSDGFEFIERDLRTDDLVELVDGADVVFHLAGQPGVRLSWAEGFRDYVDHNVLSTQRLLEAVKAVGAGRVVYASSSSVYGNAPRYPTTEDDLPRPHSPYGVTKLAGEHLCGLYAANYGVHTVSLRYFTVYGPRQRPDMAMHRLIEAGLQDEAFPLFGTGEQVRDFTFVADVVSATVAAARADVPAGSVFNVAGGSSVTMNEVVSCASELLGRGIRVDRQPAQSGDVDVTGGSIDAAREGLGWAPAVSLKDGLRAQIDWHSARASGQ